MKSENEILVQTFFRFLSAGHSFPAARKMTFDAIKPLVTWSSFKRKLDSLIAQMAPKPYIVPDKNYPKLTVGKLKELLAAYDDSLPIVTFARDTDGNCDKSFATYWEDSAYPCTDLELEAIEVIESPSKADNRKKALGVIILP